MTLDHRILAIALVSLLLLVQVAALVLIPVYGCRRVERCVRQDFLDERMTYTLLAPVAGLVVSLLEPSVHTYVTNNIALWFFLSVFVVALELRILTDAGKH